MKRILFLSTGGTIASEATDAGLAPELSGADLLRCVPALKTLCHVDCQPICNIDSTNMTPSVWLTIAKTVQARYEDYDGFVISHGTDTMAYTAAALSYLIQGGGKPIVLTGSQRPIGMDSTDSKINLLDAFFVACDGRIGGISVVFGGIVILGTRARKTYSKSFGAFSSINYPILGVVRDGKVVPYTLKKSLHPPVFYTELDPNVALFKLIPSATPAQLSYFLENSRCVIIESYGVGGIPTREGEDGPEGAGSFYDVIRGAIAKGKVVAVTTQVQNEGSDLSVYRVGHGLKNELGVLEAYDMTTEAMVAKLMWATAQKDKPVAELFYTPIADDILCGPLS